MTARITIERSPRPAGGFLLVADQRHVATVYGTETEALTFAAAQALLAALADLTAKVESVAWSTNVHSLDSALDAAHAAIKLTQRPRAPERREEESS
jgi:hypothetical protein